MELAPVEQTLARQAMQARQPLPDRIANAPELHEGLQLYLQAFFDLDSERNHGMGLQRIPSSAIRAYAREFEFDLEQTDSLEYFIGEMDREHLKKLDGKQKSEQQQQDAKARSKRGKS